MKEKKCCRGCDGYSGCKIVCESYLGLDKEREEELKQREAKFAFSKKKRKEVKRKDVILCRNCGKAFTTKNHGEKYCSDACRKAKKNERKREARKKEKSA